MSLEDSTLQQFNVAGNNKTYLGLYVKCPVFLFHILTKFGFSQKISIRVLNIKFHVNPSSGSRADMCGQRDGHDQGNRHF
jgi:hypothetical protein